MSAAGIFRAIAGVNLDIQVYAKDTTIYSLNFTDVNGSPVAITGITFLMMVKRNQSDTDGQAVATLGIGTGLSITGASNNILQIQNVFNIRGGQYFYDLQGTDGSGIVTTYIFGRFTVTQDITNNNNES